MEIIFWMSFFSIMMLFILTAYVAKSSKDGGYWMWDIFSGYDEEGLNRLFWTLFVILKLLWLTKLFSFGFSIEYDLLCFFLNVIFDHFILKYWFEHYNITDDSLRTCLLNTITSNIWLAILALFYILLVGILGVVDYSKNIIFNFCVLSFLVLVFYPSASLIVQGWKLVIIKANIMENSNNEKYLKIFIDLLIFKNINKLREINWAYVFIKVLALLLTIAFYAQILCLFWKFKIQFLILVFDL